MTFNPEISIGTIFTVCTVLLAAGGLIAQSKANGRKIEKLETKFDLQNVGGMKADLDRCKLDIQEIWKFLMDRAKMVSVRRGFLKENSPARVTGAKNEQAIRQAYKELLPDLFEFYETLPPSISDYDLSLALQIKFRGELLNKVCKRLSFDIGECLPIAVALVKERAGITAS